ncbi:Serine/arginine-rich SC35-like splicing factor SCL30A [Forsythia ovata]|uniref:Serine/arginine-rich SC35-like splicing factor SCL30A n=1 Tax=Forsythia ovata TaxID=205694 RepID=A0ABD1T5X0_9LAMI
MRGRSYSPSPPRGYGRRGRSPSPRGRHSGHGRGDGPTSLLVRNLRHDCRPEDLRRPFGQFGTVKDIYLPRDYYTGQPRGFGFVQYMDPADAAEAKYQMDGQILHGRELTVVFAEENRKKPTEMREREGGGSRGRVYDRRRSPPRYSRSPAPRYGRSTSHSRDYYSPPKRRYSRSVSPREKRYSRERSFSHSPVRERSPLDNGSRSRSRSPVRDRLPYGSRSRSQSPGRAHSPVRTRSRNRNPSRSRSRSPYPVDYSREPGKDLTPSP